ncbi:molybdenum cofactor sulfurase isoform X3 [Daktulosphaira vitifoliae]|uniref:molybdenum cofactor sulfurase isoform X3 n=1 Tax=Daktulosphaira vitifoliae TaxID=58002 RepID=UPI0021AA32C7|nr:molybdenum cofactor sulfurase isoform X3 [Daktulosphaira vitifoliae]
MENQLHGPIKNEFKRLKGVYYLDNAGSALYTDSQINKITDDLIDNLYGNPHSSGRPSNICDELIENIRHKILKHFNTNSEKYSIIFTTGATGALKLVAECFKWSCTSHKLKKNSPQSKLNISTFGYTLDNHTSVLGMRELATGIKMLCLSPTQVTDATEVYLSTSSKSNNSLFVYPAQSNFSGVKYPLSWIDKCKKGVLNKYTENIEPSKWYVLLDAASYVSTDHLDLDLYSPDFVAISFYKIFGYPTGLGALIVHNHRGKPVLSRKRYFGGGTVEITLSQSRYFVPKTKLHEWFEDGTINFLSIIAVGHGLNTLKRLTGSMVSISQKVFELAAYLYKKMCEAKHGNQKPMFQLYTDTDYTCQKTQGGIINFNIIRANGDFVGYNEVKNIADNNKIVLRVGCFCNPGACQMHLKLTNQQIKKNHKIKGHICGDNFDLIDGIPTGSVRVSFGYQSSKQDADKLYSVLISSFRQNNVIKSPNLEMKLIIKINIMSLKVSRIFIYPIKSCGAIEVQQWPLEVYGFRYDRMWAVVNEDGRCITQLQEPKLCLVKPEIDLFKEIMTLTYAGNKDKVPMTIDLRSKRSDSMRKGNLSWGGSLEGVDCGDQVAEWLSFNLDLPGLRLVKCTGRNPPRANEYGLLDKKVFGANQSQYLLTTESTIKWLMHKLEDDITDVDFDSVLLRFRSNILVSGEIPANSEVNWTEVVIGNIKFLKDELCVRCKMVNIEQSSAEENPKTLRILAQNKLNGKSVFGIYLKCCDSQSAFIEVDQLIEVK